MRGSYSPSILLAKSLPMEQKKLFIDWDISPLLEIVLFWSRRRSIFVDLDLLLKSRFIVFQDSFILPVNFSNASSFYDYFLTTACGKTKEESFEHFLGVDMIKV